MEAQFEALSELVKNGQKLNFGQDFFVKFYQAFLYSDRWQQYIKGVGTTLLVTAIALVLGVVLGAIVAMVRVGYAQQKPHHRNPILGIFNAVAQVYVTVIRGTPMMVQLLIYRCRIHSIVIHTECISPLMIMGTIQIHAVSEHMWFPIRDILIQR